MRGLSAQACDSAKRLIRCSSSALMSSGTVPANRQSTAYHTRTLSMHAARRLGARPREKGGDGTRACVRGSHRARAE